MILGCKDRFEPMLLDGTKTHSIRRGKRWNPGMRADLYLRPRQPTMRLVYRAILTHVKDIEICQRKPGSVGERFNLPGSLDNWTPLVIAIDGHRLCPDEANKLAWHDGFRTAPLIAGRFDALNEMAAFWRVENDLDDSPFDGQILYWDYSARFYEVPKGKQ